MIGYEGPEEAAEATIVACGRGDRDPYQAGRTPVQLDRSFHPGCDQALENGRGSTQEYAGPERLHRNDSDEDRSAEDFPACRNT